jgi:molybdopterin-containing oxidoreductase family membrane subunit
MAQDAPINLEHAREAALRPLTRSSWRFWALVAALTLVSVAGLVAYVVQLLRGLGAAGYADKAFWGLYEANLVAFIGVSYGGALVSAILRLTEARWRAPITRLSESMAVFSLLVGAAFAIVHVGRPDRMWRILAHPHISSPIVWDFVAIMTYLLMTLLFLYLPLIPDIALMRDRTHAAGGWRYRFYHALSLNWHGLAVQRRLLTWATTIVAILIIPVAVIVHSVLSWAFAVNSRPGWNSTIFGPYFVVAALYSGVAMVILVVAGFRAGYGLQAFIGAKHFRYLAYLMVTLDLLYLYFTFTEMLTEGYTLNEEITPILTSLLVGQYAAYFWLFIIAAGIVPLLVVALPWTRKPPFIIAASALVVGGMWLKRLLIIVPAVSNPLIAGAWGTFHPSWIAMMVTLGGVAAVPLLLMLFFKFFPILAVYEIQEIEHEAATAARWSREQAMGEAEEGWAR